MTFEKKFTDNFILIYSISVLIQECANKVPLVEEDEEIKDASKKVDDKRAAHKERQEKRNSSSTDSDSNNGNSGNNDSSPESDSP